MQKTQKSHSRLVHTVQYTPHKYNTHTLIYIHTYKYNDRYILKKVYFFFPFSFFTFSQILLKTKRSPYNKHGMHSTATAVSRKKRRRTTAHISGKNL